jgi:signal transduction histidine kinase
MTTRLRALPTLIVGFVVGLFLASLDKILPYQAARPGPLRVVVEVIDWLAPPLAGALLGGALLYAVRHQQLLRAERAATQVLAERLAGTERRQAIWVVAAAIAHDLKNPLHNLQLLLEELEGEPSRIAELLPRLRDNLGRASERLAELARAGQAPGSADEGEDRPAVELVDTLTELRGRLQSAARRSNTSVLVDCPAGLGVQGDPLALRSAIENVAANALDSLHKAGQSGTLSLTARALDGQQVELLVVDDGPGISDRLRQRLFQPFSSDKATGTGLGLAIARALARASGGDLQLAESAPGRTAFRFTFQAPPGPR